MIDTDKWLGIGRLELQNLRELAKHSEVAKQMIAPINDKIDSVKKSSAKQGIEFIIKTAFRIFDGDTKKIIQYIREDADIISGFGLEDYAESIYLSECERYKVINREGALFANTLRLRECARELVFGLLAKHKGDRNEARKEIIKRHESIKKLQVEQYVSEYWKESRRYTFRIGSNGEINIGLLDA